MIKMDFQSVREEIVSQQVDVYSLYGNSKQNLDSFSFICYPKDQKELLIQFYKKSKCLLEHNSFLDRLRIKEESFRSDPIKKIYSSLIPISHLRTLYKWLNIENKNISPDFIHKAQEFLIDNWTTKDFLPFLPLKVADSVLNLLEKGRIICRLSSTIPFCVSFTYARKMDAGLQTKHLRMYLDPITKRIVPYSKRKSCTSHPLSGPTITDVKEKLKRYI